MSDDVTDDVTEDDSLTAGAAAAIAVTITLLAAVPVGVVFGCCGMWCLMRSRGYKRVCTSSEREKRGLGGEGDKTGVIYEEPVAAVETTVFSITDNQAYGQVNTQLRNS